MKVGVVAPVTLALRRRRQEHYKFEASLGYIAGPYLKIKQTKITKNLLTFQMETTMSILYCV
jgi:hypothetical protein